MGTFRILRKNEVRIRKRISPEDSKLFDQLCANISKLNEDLVCVYDLEENDDRDKSLKLLKMASRALDIPVNSRLEGDSIAFSLRKVRSKKSAN